ncbi:MAG: DUF3784 domain-containing protein [Pseudomonadota bacterium]
MSEVTIGALIAFVGAVIPCAVLGYLIAVKERRNLIAGWNEEKVRDAKAFGTLIGWSLMALAVALAIVTALWALGRISDEWFALYALIASMIPIAALVLAKVKYGA